MDYEEAHPIAQGGQAPGDGIGDIERLQGGEHREHRKNPDNTEAAHKANGDGHGDEGVAHAPQHAHHHAHQAAHKLQHAADGHAPDAKGDDLGVGRVNSQQLVAQQKGPCAQHQPRARNQHQAQQQNAVDPPGLPRAHILAGKAQGRLGKGVLGGGDKALDIAGGRVARHGHGPKGVDRTLDEHVGNGKGTALNARGQADLHHAPQLILFQPQAAQVHPVGRVGLYQAQQHQPRGNTLGNHRGNGHAGHIQVEADDKEQVQHHVDDSRQEQEVQRPLGIPHRPQDGRAEVIEHAGRHADEIDAHVQAGLVQHLLWGAHQLQHGRCQGNADDQHNAAKDQAGQHRGVHRVPQRLAVIGAVVLGHQHVGAHRKADEQVDDQVDQRAGRAHRRQSLGPGKAPHHNNVRRIEQQLQNAGDGQRDGKADNLPQQGPVGHVDLEGAPAALSLK